MTLDLATGNQLHTIAGTGPYGTTWPYAEGSITAFVVQTNGVLLPLTSGADFTVAPLASDTAGNITLSGTIATTHAGRQLYLERVTPAVQGWLGNLSVREKGLEIQLNLLTMAMQEVRSASNRSVKTTTPLNLFAPGPDGALVIWQDGQLTPGPTAGNIAGAEGFAITASQQAVIATQQAAAAAAAAASINSRSVEDAAALQALDTVIWKTAFVRAGANAGTYFWTPGDWSAQITAADPRYIAPASHPTGASGAWIREGALLNGVHSPVLNFDAPNGIRVNGAQIGGLVDFASISRAGGANDNLAFSNPGTGAIIFSQAGAETARFDTTGLNLATGKTIRVNSVQVLGARRTGWQVPSGTFSKSTFSTSTVTVTQLAERVKALIDDLLFHGIIGA